MRIQAVSMVVVATLCGGPLAAEEPATTIGKSVANFTLHDFRGQAVSLDEAARDKIVVLAFLGCDCPLSKLYGPRLAELAKQYEPRGVVFLGLDANRQDAVTEIASYARVHQIAFPILKDLNQVVANRVGATRTPEVVVLDRQRAIRYRGRVDDQYGVESNKSYQKPAPGERNLAQALDALLEGRPIEKSVTPAVGCLIGRDRVPVADSPVTYSKQIARILNANCVYCHRPGEIAPFALTRYEEVCGWADMIDEVVREQRMPPWHADGRFGHFSNDARLSDADKATIAAWVVHGAPEGDPADLPAPPQFAEGWMIQQPEQVVYMKSEPYKVQATGVLDYQFFVTDPGWKEDKWIAAVEARPSNRSVVHHILLFVLPPNGNLTGGVGSGNDFLAAYAPGIRPEPLTAGMARFVPAGSKLIFQMHYTPNGSPQEDRSYCGFVFADPKTVKKEVQVASAVNYVFKIPPGDADHDVKARYVFRRDTLLLTLMPHMHLRGKSFRYEARYPDGTTEVLLDVPRYDFGWQTNYRLAEPKRLPAGTRLDCLARFDNSADNPANPNPHAVVRFGDQTFEEMMIGFFEATPVDQDLQHPPSAPPHRSRLEEFAAIMAATGGEPDDNVRIGASIALPDPQIFIMYGRILQSMVPQLDRLCITAVQDGKVYELFGPTGRMQGGGRRGIVKPPSKKEGKAVEISESLTAGAEMLRGPLPTMDADGESLAEYATAAQVTVHDDLTGVKGKLAETMLRRGARSSLHVPVEIKGVKGTVNFWSTDERAFPPPAQALLTDVAKTIATGKISTQAAAK